MQGLHVSLREKNAVAAGAAVAFPAPSIARARAHSRALTRTLRPPPSPPPLSCVFTQIVTTTNTQQRRGKDYAQQCQNAHDKWKEKKKKPKLKT